MISQWDSFKLSQTYQEFIPKFETVRADNGIRPKSVIIIPFIITWGTICSTATMSVTLCFQVRYEKGRIPARSIFLSMSSSGWEPSICLWQHSTRKQGSHAVKTGQCLVSTTEHGWAPVVRPVLWMCVRERENLCSSGRENETQVNGKSLVSNLLIFLEVKKTLTTLLS